ncbi:hypothetical protein [uncultured Anaerovibrio sp.]|nr:hypothetical protein [uncultured Anaerovibrio sp.]
MTDMPAVCPLSVTSLVHGGRLSKGRSRTLWDSDGLGVSCSVMQCGPEK